MSLLPKSLHTVTVLVRVARDIRTRDRTATPRQAVNEARFLLGLNDKFDQYGLLDAAVRQLS